MKLPEEGDIRALTFFGLLDILVDFERRLRELESQSSNTKVNNE